MSPEKPTDNVPVHNFASLLVVAGLATQTMLKRDRRQLAEGQKPVAQYWTGTAYAMLYNTADAVDMPPLSPGRQRLYDKARTCARCAATSKDTYAKGRDGQRYCFTCQEPAAKQLFLQERAADRLLVTQWARGVLTSPTAVLAARERLPLWTRNVVVDLDGQVLLDEEIRYNRGEPHENHPQAEELRKRSPLDVIDKIEALRGRRMIAWWPNNAPELVTLFDQDGLEHDYATRVRHDDGLGSWYDRWIGELADGTSYLHYHPRLKQHEPPRDPHECVTKMRQLLTLMADGVPVTHV